MPKVYIETSDVEELMMEFAEEFEDEPVFVKNKKRKKFDDGTSIKHPDNKKYKKRRINKND